MSIEWLDHKGKKILYIKYSGMSPQAQLDQIREATKALLDTKVQDNLTLSDISGTFVNEDFIALAKDKGKESAPVTKKAAVVGISGVRKILLAAVNRISTNPRKPFDTVAEAKDWLAED
jgi:hypothetical protein